MSWIGKWEEKNKEQHAKDIELCRQHPMGWKITAVVFTLGFGALIIFMVLSGAIPLAAIAFGFAVWMGQEYLKIYREAFPKRM